MQKGSKRLRDIVVCNIKYYREQAKISQEDLSLKLGKKKDFIEKLEDKGMYRRFLTVVLLDDIARILNEREEEPEDLKFSGKELGELVTLIDKGTISSAIAKKVLEELFNEVKMPNKIIEEKGWVQISDEGAIKEVVMKVLENNPKSIADYKAGKDRALGFLVGQALKETKGKANPGILNKLFLEELKK